MTARTAYLIIMVMSTAPASGDTGPVWSATHAVESADTGYRTTGVYPWMMAEPLDQPIPPERHCLLLEMKVSKPIGLRFQWYSGGQHTGGERTVRMHVDAVDEYRFFAANLDENGMFKGAGQFRIEPGREPDVTFDIRRVDFVTPDRVPERFIPDLVQFRCFTSKLHYRPDERIEYGATLSAAMYPDRQSSKILDIALQDVEGRVVATTFQQYGLRDGSRFKEIRGILDVPRPLAPGRYTLLGTSTDQRSGLELTWRHHFGVQKENDPALCETSFKFVKDFSIIRGPDDRWHIFSITGDLQGDHGWSGHGMERTFSHSSSDDLRHWTMHRPVLSISDDLYPDGQGRYQDRNIWAPHVIFHDGRYWMFYTSVNQYVSQSISLATSPDLFEWTAHENNPIFTLEGVPWAHWSRDGWADCRDPCILMDEGRFYLYVTASVHGPGETGGIVVAESDDLLNWENPRIAVRGHIVSESPQVWRDGDTYCMTTSSIGAGAFTSRHPVNGWEPTAFPRPDIAVAERYIQTSGSYAEEVTRFPNGDWLMAALTFRHFGNSIYLFRMKTEGGVPVSYENP